ncbi:hypothetical protein [Novosphingobium acidiphilum]|uniref:hypothetical protein n=1 Tax=Novosphingobium acidiphilum TaxID=505248 RepID=UPI00040A86DA|nr:hypothetical protein [Novosphingobium acidiphilum]
MKWIAGLFIAVAIVPGMARAQQTTYGGAYYPTYGSPNSLQFQAAKTALDLETVDPEGDARLGPEGDSDTIGGAFTYWGVPGETGERYDAHYQHARRVFKGSRARLVIDAPVNVIQAGTITSAFGSEKGATAVLGTVNVGLEMPVLPNWLITPRVAYGVAGAGGFFGGNGELATASLSSRYQIRQIGRGDLIIGNSVSYTHSAKILTSQDFFAPTINWVFRNGLAYQLPLKSRMFGRQSSLRASYVYTVTTGDPVTYKHEHEAGLSIGVRTREAEQKNGFEQLRVGLLYTHSHFAYVANSGYDSATLTLGYRF